jgi:hypothetical protein
VEEAVRNTARWLRDSKRRIEKTNRERQEPRNAVNRLERKSPRKNKEIKRTIRHKEKRVTDVGRGAQN